MATHTVGLHIDGTVYCWGRNYEGQLGDGTTTARRTTPAKVVHGAYGVSGFLGDDSNNKITAVALGAFHSIALAADGTVYSWGRNAEGQLGNNETTQQITPVKVLAGAYSGTTYLGDDSNNKITAVALGYNHSIALAADGTVYCWGVNGDGQLGDNTTTQSNTPIKVHGVDNVGDLSLPVELTSFTARQEGSTVVLEWITESEIENLGFILGRRNLKFETGNWEEIASYKTHAELWGQGSTTSRTEYQFTDAAVQPSWTYEYRLADVDYSGNTKYHGTRSVTIKSDDQLLIPETFSLKPAYPNPFNPYTVISFALPEAAEVSMRVMDVTGKTVRLLVNNQGYPAGEFSILWDGQSNTGVPLSSGVYFIQLTTGENIRSQKIVLLR